MQNPAKTKTKLRFILLRVLKLFPLLLVLGILFLSLAQDLIIHPSKASQSPFLEQRGKGPIIKIKVVKTGAKKRYILQRNGYSEKLVNLTFLNNPSDHTSQILQILRRHGAKATFFIVGKKALIQPEELNRILKEGHELGNQTFSSRDLALSSKSRILAELTSTQRIIQRATGHSTLLARPTVLALNDEIDEKKSEVILRAQEMGYICMIEEANVNTSLPSDAVVKECLQLLRTKNVLVLPADARTVKVLPEILRALKKNHYKTSLFSELIHSSHERIMPTAIPRDIVLGQVIISTYKILNILQNILIFLLWVYIGLTLLRALAALFLGLWYWRITRKPVELNPDFKPLVSIIVPAYNEEKVIGKCIQSLLASTYPQQEIIVVDDGSTDRTSDVVAKFLSFDQIKLVRKPNGGKASAINVGINHAEGEILVVIDADTKFNSDTVAHFVKHFQNPQVGAVSGNAKVGNRVSLLTIWQSIEYIMGFNLSRRMFSLLNCVTVVPGAVGAFRKEAVERAGFFSSDTITEDTDITISIRKLGYLIPYEEKSIGWTEAPDTLSGLWKQRYRWSYGTLQTLWKHRDAFFNPRYGTLGMFGLPLVLIFEAILPIIAPVLDLALIYFLFTRAIRLFLTYFFLYVGLEILTSWVAFSLDKERKGALIWVIFQRFVYRQIMYLVVIKSFVSALKGSHVKWQKLIRRGTVK